MPLIRDHGVLIRRDDLGGILAGDSTCCCPDATTETPDGCDCVHCSATAPAIMQVRFQGVVAGSNPCGDGVCTDWNDTWFDVPQGNEGCEIVPCEYHLRTGLPCLGIAHITIFENTVDVTVFEGALGVTQYFRKTIITPADCWNLGGVALDTAGGDYYCDWSNATCELRGKTTGSDTACEAFSGLTPDMIPLTFVDVTDGDNSVGNLCNVSWRMVQVDACTYELDVANSGMPPNVTGVELIFGVGVDGNAYAIVTISTTSGEATFFYDHTEPTMDYRNIVFEFEPGILTDTCYTWDAATAHTGC